MLKNQVRHLKLKEQQPPCCKHFHCVPEERQNTYADAKFKKKKKTKQNKNPPEIYKTKGKQKLVTKT